MFCFYLQTFGHNYLMADKTCHVKQIESGYIIDADIISTFSYCEPTT